MQDKNVLILVSIVAILSLMYNVAQWTEGENRLAQIATLEGYKSPSEVKALEDEISMLSALQHDSMLSAASMGVIKAGDFGLTNYAAKFSTADNYSSFTLRSKANGVYASFWWTFSISDVQLAALNDKGKQYGLLFERADDEHIRLSSSRAYAPTLLTTTNTTIAYMWGQEVSRALYNANKVVDEVIV